MNDINRYLDAAILKPETTRAEMIEALQICIRLQTYSACVRPCDIEAAQELCKETDTKVCVVLGFPHGDQLSESKAEEASQYIKLGVDEIDMVVNYGLAKSGDWDAVKKDMCSVSSVTKPAEVPLKVIFETAQLAPSEIIRLVELSVQAGADFVKTSTGFNGEGAKDSDVQLMLNTAAGRIKVKPSGGIRDFARAKELVDMGVHRLGINWSSAEAICSGLGADSAGGSY